jgi:hypothetical protein
MFGFAEGKSAFEKWERATAQVLETWLKSPLVLEPAGAWLSTTMRMKAMTDRAVAGMWGAMGLPTKRDQERTLHALHTLESRLLDLEEKLADLADTAGSAPRRAPAEPERAPVEPA